MTTQNLFNYKYEDVVKELCTLNYKYKDVVRDLDKRHVKQISSYITYEKRMEDYMRNLSETEREIVNWFNYYSVKMDSEHTLKVGRTVLLKQYKNVELYTPLVNSERMHKFTYICNVIDKYKSAQRIAKYSR